jgi:hypothetical protein
MKKLVVAFVAGVGFALGLGIAGMTNPEKVRDFLDITGNWDPSLGLVMGGAIAFHVGAVSWARTARKPVLSNAFGFTTRSSIDGPLLAGAALFGLGWGAIGYCPGPAVVSLVRLSTPTIAFVTSMLAGMAVYSWIWPARLGGVTRQSDTRHREPS